jgi:two-component system C4-dicarboxylate transport sensor histidine kinase DctB
MSPRFVFRLGFVLALALGVLVATYVVADHMHTEAALRRADERAALYRASLVSALEQYRHLPAILARDPFVIATAADPVAERVDPLNRRLAAFAALTDVNALYLLLPNGLTVAASNWNKAVSYLGENYGYRPYFLQALAGDRGAYFAIGATTKRPGYFIAAPVRDGDGGVAAVMALKVEFDQLLASWRAAGEQVYVTDANGVIVLGTRPDWEFATTRPIPDPVRAAMDSHQQFQDEPLHPLEMRMAEDTRVSVEGREYLRRALDVGHLGWTLNYLVPRREVVAANGQAVLYVAVPLVLSLALGLFVYATRIRRALAVSQDARRDLRLLNADLAREVEERKAAEKRLERAQLDLRRVSKLAALGQLSASVSHELGQPIAAIRNYLASADLPGAQMDDDTRAVLTHVGRITDRMAHITKQLKFFGQPRETTFAPFDARDAVRDALGLMTADTTDSRLRLILDLPEHPVPLRGDKVRLEQVLINLIRNGLDAMTGKDEPRLRITLRLEDPWVDILVADRGDGLPEGKGDQVFEPFFTTKASGDGLGLGLAISASILEDHGGSLTARDRADGGAEFRVRLPLDQGSASP